MLTRNPAPPFRVVQSCLGHAFNYGYVWEVVDQNYAYPLEDALARGPDTLMDEEWCRAECERLNAKYGAIDA